MPLNIKIFIGNVILLFVALTRDTSTNISVFKYRNGLTVTCALFSGMTKSRQSRNITVGSDERHCVSSYRASHCFFNILFELTKNL